MKLSIIIPVYNEEKTIQKIIKEVQDVHLGKISKEIIIVEDCSTDSTKQILDKLKDYTLKIFFHSRNKGKGFAIRTGLKHATGDIIVVQDADLEYDPRDFRKLLAPFEDKRVKVVYGSRIKSIRRNQKNMYKLHFIGNIFLTSLTNLLYGSKINDMETGYKLFRRDIFEHITLKSKRFDFEPEITAKLLKKGYKIHEVPIHFVGRKFDEGKKITWRDGVLAAWYLLKYRFVD